MSAYDFRKIKVYQKAFSLAREVFHLSKTFPKEEINSLTDQIRRSSRSVCACLGEAYRKKTIPGAFCIKNIRLRHGKFGNTRMAGFFSGL
jgi:hypothetical protein